MQVMILSCNTGEGHNSCAKAMKEVYDAHGEECVIYDALRFISPGVSRFLAWGHVFLYRHMPWFFNWGYGFAERHPGSFEEGTILYRLFAKGADHLMEEIQRAGFGAVICTHPMAALILTEVQKKYALPVKTAFVATDYTCSPSVKNGKLDWYFIPDESLKAEFLCTNIPEENMVVSGIPIRQVFYERTDKTAARKELGLPETGKHVVLMCGSMGCGPMEELVGTLEEVLPEDAVLTVVCGRNDKLKSRLEQRYGFDKQIRICGFVKNVFRLLDSADLYLTKPGGISTSEAAAKNVPMVLINAVAGCEAYNRQFYVERGYAKSGAGRKEIREICESILTEESVYQAWKQHLMQQEKRNASMVIYETMK